MRTAASLALLLSITGCGAAAATPSASALCPGWALHRTPGGTSFALPSAVEAEREGQRAAFVHAEGDVYYELGEWRVAGLESQGSDRAAAQGILEGLGEPDGQQMQPGWSVTSQGVTEFHGRAAAERVIDMQGQVVRRERYVRSGDSIVSVISMVRYDREDAGRDAIERCFESAITFSAPPIDE